MGLQGKVALITGGGSGIAEAAAKRLAADGVKVAVLGRTEDELEAVVGEVRRQGAEAMAVAADVSRPDQMQRAVTAVGGSIIVTSSVNGTRMFSNTGATAYASSKAAQVAFTKMIALELTKDKVRANVICPGYIKTEIQGNTEQRNLRAAKPAVEFPEGVVPLMDGGPGMVEQVAELVHFLASDASSLITGTEIWIDGAESLLQG